MPISNTDLPQLPTLEQLDREMSTRSYIHFVRQSWNVLEPSTKYLHNWHIELISEYLQAVTEGQIKRLIINQPPRYMKSMLVSVMWPAWMWIHQPHLRWIFGSYSLNLSLKHSLDRRRLIQSQWYQKNWSKIIQLSDDQNQKSEFQNTATGYMVATSVGGTVTGRGGHIIVLDDPLNPEEALSDSLRENCNRWVDQTLSTRLDDKRKGAIVVVMHRLHENDVTGHLLNKKDEMGAIDWEVLSLPAESPKRVVVNYPITEKQLIREQGDVLWPAREDERMLMVQKRAMGSYAFSGQYDQSPSPVGGGMFKEHWWKFYNIGELDLKWMDQWIQSWDMNFKETDDGSFLVGQVWARKGSRCYLIDQVRLRTDFPGAVKAVINMTHKWPQCGAKLIENKANGPAVIATLGNTISGIIAVEPKSSKESRANAITYLVEAGNVYLPHPMDVSWAQEFIDEHSAFPSGKNDDQVDSLVMALSYFPNMVQEVAGEVEESAFGGPRRLTSTRELDADGSSAFSSSVSENSYSDMNPW